MLTLSSGCRLRDSVVQIYLLKAKAGKMPTDLRMEKVRLLLRRTVVRLPLAETHPTPSPDKIQELLQSSRGTQLALVTQRLMEVQGMGNLATLRWYENAYEAALDLARRALERCEEVGLSLERRLPLGDMGAAALALHATELARQCLEESLALARQTGDRTQEILCLTHLGWLSIRVKRAGEALDYLTAALSLAQRIGSCAEQSWLHSGLAEAQRLAGHREPALAHVNQARELAQQTGAAYDEKLAGWVLNRLNRA